MTRSAKFLWMRDLLEHMHRCQDEWQSANPRRERMLADTMRRDLDECRRICESIERDVANVDVADHRQAAAA